MIRDYIPEWLQRLVGVQSETEERTRMLSPMPYCPARLPNVRFAEVPYDTPTKRKTACASYEIARGETALPSPRHCPHCQYNTDKLRRDADPLLVKAVLAHFS